MERKVAAAIGYCAEDVAPRLLASGKGKTAEQIVVLAKEAGVEVIEDSALAVLLEGTVEPGDVIPQWCWEATAKILAFVFERKGKL